MAKFNIADVALGDAQYVKIQSKPAFTSYKSPSSTNSVKPAAKGKRGKHGKKPFAADGTPPRYLVMRALSSERFMFTLLEKGTIVAFRERGKPKVDVYVDDGCWVVDGEHQFTYGPIEDFIKWYKAAEAPTQNEPVQKQLTFSNTDSNGNSGGAH